MLMQEKESAIDSLLIDMMAEITTLMKEVETKGSELSTVKDAPGCSNHDKPFEEVQPRQAKESSLRLLLWRRKLYGLQKHL